MGKPAYNKTACPIARSLERIGDAWSMLILREALAGLTRFDSFEKHLRIAPTILSRRLNMLVEEGLLTRHQYSDRPPRHEYLVTGRASDFRPVLLMLLEWGNTHFADEGPALILIDKATGATVKPILVDQESGKPITLADHVCVAGPAAPESMRRRLAARAETVAAQSKCPDI